jgi:hypothetical protein
MAVRSHNHLPAIANALRRVRQPLANEGARRLAGVMQGNVADTPFHDAVEAGVYVRTPDESGYAEAARESKRLTLETFASLAPRSWQDIAPQQWAAIVPDEWQELSPQRWAQLAEPVPEIPAPPPGSAAVGCASQIGQLQEVGSAHPIIGKHPWFYDAATRVDAESLVDVEMVNRALEEAAR